MLYSPRREPFIDTIEGNGVRLCVHRWPGSDPEPVVLLHGYLDTGETFQFVVDHLSNRFSLIAPDLRGFGRSGWAPQGYWFADYLADLDILIDRVSPNIPVTLIGHSMGGNIALLYAGIRSSRVARVVSLEGFGLPPTSPAEAPARYRKWLDQLRVPSPFGTYPSYDAFADTLLKRNPRLTRERAEFIARAWAMPDAAGVVVRADPAHRRVFPTLYRHEETEACWAEITAPVLLVAGELSDLPVRMGSEVEGLRIQQLLRNVEVARIPHAGHMLHHEQPEETAKVVDRFLGRLGTE